MKFLNDQERAELVRLHKKERDRRVCDRIKAVLLYDQGWEINQIAEAVFFERGSSSKAFERLSNKAEIKARRRRQQ